MDGGIFPMKVSIFACTKTDPGESAVLMKKPRSRYCKMA